jgi:hypothetical protein
MQEVRMQEEARTSVRDVNPGELASDGEDSRTRERSRATRPAWHAATLTSYYLALFAFLFWLSLDIWTGGLRFMILIGFENIKDRMATESSSFHAVSYTLIGGAMGSILYSIRSFFTHYAGRRRTSYSRRWFGKYLTAPWEGAALAMVVASLIRGGVVVFGGQTAPSFSSGANAFAAFAIGTLVGFSMREVVGWLHKVTRTMFGGREECDDQVSDQEADQPGR